MRAFWVTLCAVTALTSVQAESYRSKDRDDGFNPLGFMRDMPSPMNMFDARDDHHKDWRRRRPPFYPPPPPAPGYGAPYAYPAAPWAPANYAGHPYQPQQSPVPTQTSQPPRSIPQAAATSSPRENPQPVETPSREPQAVTPTHESSDSGYSFRPLTPAPELKPPQEQDVDLPPFASALKPAPDAEAQQPPAAAEPIQRKEQPSGQDTEGEVMVNGKPAVFRPMNMGTEPPEN